MPHVTLNGTGDRTVIAFLPLDSIAHPPSDLSDKQCKCIVRTLGGGVYYVRNTVSEVLDRVRDPED